MIRELTKSANSFTWALSLLALKQGLNLLSPGQQDGRDLFSPMTQVAVGQLDESMQGFFRAGDSMQSGMVDMVFSMVNPANWMNPSSWQNMGGWMNPGNWMASATNFTRNAMGGGCGQTRRQTSATPPSQGTSSGSGSPAAGNDPVSNQSPAAGWGPMP